MVERLRLISARIPLARILHVVHLELLRVCVSLEYRVRFVIVSDGGCFVADDDGASILLVVSVRPIAVACPNGVNSGGGRSGACGMDAGRRKDIFQCSGMTIETEDIKPISTTGRWKPTVEHHAPAPMPTAVAAATPAIPIASHAAMREPAPAAPRDA